MTEDVAQSEGVRREYDWEDTSPTFAVLVSIAFLEHGNAKLTEEVLDEPLNNYLDTNALDKVVQSGESVTVEFTVSQYTVRISGTQVNVTFTDTI